MNKNLKNLRTLVVAYFVFMNQFHLSVNTDSKKLRNPKIVIVGAGASGIAAASKLFQNGLTNFILLEAENRIGGRIYTASLGRYNIKVSIKVITNLKKFLKDFKIYVLNFLLFKNK